MLTEVVGERREAGSSWDMTLSTHMQNEDTYFTPLYTVTSNIPQNLNPAYKWLLFPCFTVIVNTVRPNTRKHGLAVVVHDQDVDGIDTGGGVPAVKSGWGGSHPNDPQSNPTPMPTQVNGPLEHYYEPGWMWQYWFANPVAFRPRGPLVAGEGPPVSTYTVTLAEWPFDWRGPVQAQGDLSHSTFIFAEDHFFITPGVHSPKQLVMTFQFQSEIAGATWTVMCSDLVVVPFAGSSESTVIAGLGLPGVRPRGKIVGMLRG